MAAASLLAQALTSSRLQPCYGSKGCVAHRFQIVLGRAGARVGHLEVASVAGGVLEVHRNLHPVLAHRVTVGAPRVHPTASTC